MSLEFQSPCGSTTLFSTILSIPHQNWLDIKEHVLWPKSIKCHYLSKSQVWTVLSNIEINSQGFSRNQYWQRHRSPFGQPQTSAHFDQPLCFCRSSTHSDRLTAVHQFSNNISSWLAVQRLIWRCKLWSFPWRCKFQTSIVGAVCWKTTFPLTNCTAAKLLS